MIRTPAPATIADTQPGDIVEVADAFGLRVVRVEWQVRGAHGAMCSRYSEVARVSISGGVCMHFLVPGHVEVVRVIDPDAPREEREQGAAHAG